MTSKSVEEQQTQSANGGKLVPYEDDISDESETERVTAGTREMMMKVDGACCGDSSVQNDTTDTVVNTSNTQQLPKPPEPVVASVPGCSLPDVNNSHSAVLSESSSSVSVQEVESRELEKEAVTAEDRVAVLADGEVGCSTKAAADDSSAYQLQNGHLSSDSTADRHAVSGRKRHARHKSKRRHEKKQRRHHAFSSACYSSDEEVEYVWVEKTAETVAQQHTGKCYL